jgi:5-(carboxyamino)imidazole ribonucleotide synthase
VACVLEAFMPLDYEISVVIARGFDGASQSYPLALNVHADGILAVSTAARSDENQTHAKHQDQARRSAQTIAQGLGYYGVLCVEFFVLKDGSLVVNEIAPRPHNSGHYTIDACVTSQFEQQARIMAGLPLGSPELLTSAVMLNILGDVWFDGDSAREREPNWALALSVPVAKLHLYGKREARRGRKMGHVTILGETVEAASAGAARVAAALGIQAME